MLLILESKTKKVVEDMKNSYFRPKFNLTS